MSTAGDEQGEDKGAEAERGVPAPDPGGRPPLLQVPLTAASIADRVHRALDAADLDEFAALLSPDVHWGAPGDPAPPCRNRDQVLRWYANGRAKGRRAAVIQVEVHGDALLVGMTLEDREQRWQVMRVDPRA